MVETRNPRSIWLQRHSSPGDRYFSRLAGIRRFARLGTLLAAALMTIGCGVRRSDLGEIVTDFPEAPTAKATDPHDPSAAPPVEEKGSVESASNDDSNRATDQAPATEPPK